MIKKTVLLIFLNTFCFCLYAQETYYAGYKRIFVEDERFDEFPVAIWFPTKQVSKIEHFGPFALKIALGAKPANGKFPLVIISHGSGGSLLGHRDTAQFLAENGYIVAALLHPRNNFEDNSDEGTTSNWVNRPKHVISTLDNILRSKKFVRHIDTNKIAVVGHSAGGYTALTLLGAIPDTRQSRLHCQNNGKLDKGYCALGNVNRHQDKKIEGLTDNRFRAAVLLAPVGVLFSSENSLAKVEAPILLYRAEFDKQLNFPFHSELIAKTLASSELSYRTLKNANHFAFIAPFPKRIAKEVGLPAEDRPGFDRRLAHDKINVDILDFLTQALQ
jgi:predicted dienelactone hydrolase